VDQVRVLQIGGCRGSSGYEQSRREYVSRICRVAFATCLVEFYSRNINTVSTSSKMILWSKCVRRRLVAVTEALDTSEADEIKF